MLNRRKRDAQQRHQHTEHAYQPEHVEAGEFTMSSTPDLDPGTSSDSGIGPDSTRQVFDREQIEWRRAEWENVQARFVEDPTSAVKDADKLVAGAIDEITRSFSEERSELEQEWKDGDTSTEDLRVSLQRYREFLERLMSV